MPRYNGGTPDVSGIRVQIGGPAVTSGSDVHEIASAGAGLTTLIAGKAVTAHMGGELSALPWYQEIALRVGVNLIGNLLWTTLGVVADRSGFFNPRMNAARAPKVNLSNSSSSPAGLIMTDKLNLKTPGEYIGLRTDGSGQVQAYTLVPNIDPNEPANPVLTEKA